MKFGMGQPVHRLEDKRFITGAGRYTADLLPEKCLHALVLRSPHAHARILAIRADAARAMPGVLDVVTGRDLADSVQPFAGLSVRENIAVGAFLRHAARSDALARADAVGREVGLGALLDQPAGELTVAGRKRLELARALAT
jgi:CO/xanthine dehydrogenase Mo-binding subunit